MRYQYFPITLLIISGLPIFSATDLICKLQFWSRPIFHRCVWPPGGTKWFKRVNEATLSPSAGQTKRWTMGRVQKYNLYVRLSSQEKWLGILSVGSADSVKVVIAFKGLGWNIKVVSIVIWAFVRHTVRRCLTFSALQEVTWSRGQVLANHYKLP